ncbi:type II toxin-antitoxin system RelE/ParE family toxin [Parapusillimonas sp. JC17]|uniref:type II toxin-antitoxin system RelE/ParE family toxin n=1 Tax=Parapusillimonas sp. JC17 TaxID=3445768 RepID=UPI003F9FEB91
MTSLGYRLVDAAEADLRGISRYTRKQWGNAQVRRYIITLERHMARLATRQGVYQDMNAL